MLIMRRLFAIASVLSFVACLAAGGLWVHSYRQTDALTAGYWGYQYHPHYTNYYDAWELDAFSDHGRVKVCLYLRGCVAGPGRYEAFPRQRGRLLTIGPADPYRLDAEEYELARAERLRLVPGLRYRFNSRLRLVAVPHAAAVGLTAVLPAIAILGVFRRRRSVRAGLCPVCGYDLRASRERCPECGTQIAAGGDG